MDFDSNFPLNPEYGITGKIKQGYVYVQFPHIGRVDRFGRTFYF